MYRLLPQPEPVGKFYKKDIIGFLFGIEIVQVLLK
jgi:hypothetical protein